MKTSQLAALSAAAIAMCTLVSTTSNAAPGNGNGNSDGSGSASTIPAIPDGELFANPMVVQTGTKPMLTWSIVYPNWFGGGSGGSGGGVGFVDPPGTLVITQNNTYVSVQPIGTGITACDSTQGTTPLAAEARFSLNGSAYQQLFYGTQANVNSAYSLYIKKMNAGSTLNFSGRYVKNGVWSPMYTTLSSNMQVVALVNGDTPPTAFPLYQSSTLASYLRPYLDASGKIKIGPMSVIIMMELGQTNHSMNCFDYQDMVLLVTFSTKHPNNGHGNNLDGVDSSNPGNGHGGPNGMVDPSGGVDDEIK